MESVQRIEKLLEKYFEAGTSLAEERELEAYFKNPDIPAELQAYQPIFAHREVAREERYEGQWPSFNKRKIATWIAVAAVFGLGFGLFIGQTYQEQEQEKAEYAYQETRKALQLLAMNLDRGTEKIAYLQEFEETTDKIYNNPN